MSMLPASPVNTETTVCGRNKAVAFASSRAAALLEGEGRCGRRGHSGSKRGRAPFWSRAVTLWMRFSGGHGWSRVSGGDKRTRRRTEDEARQVGRRGSFGRGQAKAATLPRSGGSGETAFRRSTHASRARKGPTGMAMASGERTGARESEAREATEGPARGATVASDGEAQARRERGCLSRTVRPRTDSRSSPTSFSGARRGTAQAAPR